MHMELSRVLQARYFIVYMAHGYILHFDCRRDEKLLSLSLCICVYLCVRVCACVCVCRHVSRVVEYKCRVCFESSLFSKLIQMDKTI